MYRKKPPQDWGMWRKTLFEVQVKLGSIFDLEKSLVSISLEFGQLLLPISAFPAVEEDSMEWGHGPESDSL